MRTVKVDLLVGGDLAEDRVGPASDLDPNAEGPPDPPVPRWAAALFAAVLSGTNRLRAGVSRGVPEEYPRPRC